MTGVVLDTNTVSDLIRARGEVVRRVTAAPMTALGILVVTEAELDFGLAKRPDARRLHLTVRECLKRVDGPAPGRPDNSRHHDFQFLQRRQTRIL